jgi:hypothetical protein
MVLGYDNANWTGSMVNTVSFKGFDFSFMIYVRTEACTRTSSRTCWTFPVEQGLITGTNDPSTNINNQLVLPICPFIGEALGYRDGSFAESKT